MHIYGDVVTAIVEERRRQGVSVKALSRRCEIPYASLDRYLHGHPVPSDRMRMLCEALDIEVQATVTKRQQDQATEVAA